MLDAALILICHGGTDSLKEAASWRLRMKCSSSEGHSGQAAAVSQSCLAQAVLQPANELA